MKAYPVILQFCVTAHVSSKQVNVVADYYENESEAYYTCFGQEIRGEFEAAAVQYDLKDTCEDGEEFDLELPCIVENGRVFHKGQDLSEYVDIEQVEEACWQLEQKLKSFDLSKLKEAPVCIFKTMAQALGLPAKGATLTRGSLWIGVSQYQTYEGVWDVFCASVTLEGKPWDDVVSAERESVESCIDSLYYKLKDKINE